MEQVNGEPIGKKEREFEQQQAEAKNEFGGIELKKKRNTDDGGPEKIRVAFDSFTFIPNQAFPLNKIIGVSEGNERVILDESIGPGEDCQPEEHRRQDELEMCSIEVCEFVNKHPQCPYRTRSPVTWKVSFGT